MSTLAQTIRHATRRAEDDEETAPQGKGAAGGDTEEEASDDEEDTTAESQTDDESEEDDEEDPAKPTATAPKGKAYGLAQATQTLELCAIAGVSAKAAYGYVKAETPLAEVRAKLAAGKAPPAERLETARPKNDAASGWDDVVAKVNATLPTASKR